MRATFPLLVDTDFPMLKRQRPDTLQVNLGYTCNQSCVHCHVDAGPNRTEQMDRDTVEQVLDVLRAGGIATLDLTGGAPEMNPHFRTLVAGARALGVKVMDRCNLTILDEPGYEDIAEFLAAQGVEIVASLPCYLEDNVDRQRGRVRSGPACGCCSGSMRWAMAATRRCSCTWSITRRGRCCRRRRRA